jgi:hypothetical protein
MISIIYSKEFMDQCISIPSTFECEQVPYLHRFDHKFNLIVKRMPHFLHKLANEVTIPIKLNIERVNERQFLMNLLKCCEIVKIIRARYHVRDAPFSKNWSKGNTDVDTDDSYEERWWREGLIEKNQRLLPDRFAEYKELTESILRRNVSELSREQYDAIQLNMNLLDNDGWDIFHKYGVFFMMLMLCVPNIIETMKYEFQIYGNNMSICEYDFNIDDMVPDKIRVIEHSNHWLRIFVLKLLCQKKILVPDNGRGIALLYVELIRQDRVNYPYCKYCSQLHPTRKCQFMNNRRCRHCQKFVECNVFNHIGLMFCGNCHDKKVQNIDHNCSCGQPYCGEYYEHFCAICEEFGHSETECGQLCNCDILYCHSRYDCPHVQTDCKPGHFRKKQKICL